MKIPDLKKKAGMPLLVVIAIAVWGSNGYRLIKGVSSEKSNVLLDVKPISRAGFSLADSAWLNWTYPDDIRDPFSWPRKKPEPVKKRPKKIPAKPVVRQPLSLRLNGIIGDAENPHALVTGPGDICYLVSAGDRIDTLQVVSITKDQVNFECKGYKYRITK